MVKIVVEFRSWSRCISLGWLSLAIMLNSTLSCCSFLSATNCLGIFIPMLQPTVLSNHNLGVLFHFYLFNLAHLNPSATTFSLIAHGHISSHPLESECNHFFYLIDVGASNSKFIELYM